MHFASPFNQSKFLTASLVAFTFTVFTGKLSAQHTHEHGEDWHPNVTLHVNPDIRQCDFDIASNLTQAEWKRATREIGNVLFLDPLSGAAPLGRFNWGLQLESTSFNIDQESGAWNNTFHHPDSAHYLTGENGKLVVPALRFRFGLSNRWDAGIYYTSAKPLGANYGFLGVETRYNVWNNEPKGWFGTVRASMVTDANIKDFNIFSTGIDAMVSKRFFNIVTPYAGAAVNWNHGHIVSKEVSLKDENSLGFRGIAGVDLHWRFLTFGYEVQIGDSMKNRSFKLGVLF